MKVTLFVRAPKKHVVVEHEVVIGRDKDCDRRVLSNNVSRKPCQLAISGSDVGVRNPVNSNGAQINSQQTESNIDTKVAKAVPFEPTPGKMKSLFGMFGKKKNRASAEDTVPTPRNSESSEESGNAAVELLIVAGNAQFDEETVVFDQENAFTSDEDEMELLADEDEALSDEGEYLDDNVEEKAVDSGFADFLNNVDQPPAWPEFTCVTL